MLFHTPVVIATFHWSVDFIFQDLKIDLFIGVSVSILGSFVIGIKCNTLTVLTMMSFEMVIENNCRSMCLNNFMIKIWFCINWVITYKQCNNSWTDILQRIRLTICFCPNYFKSTQNCIVSNECSSHMLCEQKKIAVVFIKTLKNRNKKVNK